MSRLSQKARQHRAALRSISDKIAEQSDEDNQEIHSTLGGWDHIDSDSTHPFDRAKDVVGWMHRTHARRIQDVSLNGYQVEDLVDELDRVERFNSDWRDYCEDEYPYDAGYDPNIDRYYRKHVFSDAPDVIHKQMLAMWEEHREEGIADEIERDIEAALYLEAKHHEPELLIEMYRKSKFEDMLDALPPLGHGFVGQDSCDDDDYDYDDDCDGLFTFGGWGSIDRSMSF